VLLAGVVGLIYQVEPLAGCIEEVKKHAYAHWEEVASFKDSRPLDVEWESYLKFEQLGQLLLATARSDVALVGYVAMFVRSDLHSRGVFAAEAAFYYVEKRPMRGLVQRNLIRFVCRYLRERGVHFIRFRNKMAHSNSAILENIGFVADEALYVLKTGA
jgi:hypothetical protein